METKVLDCKDHVWVKTIINKEYRSLNKNEPLVQCEKCLENFMTKTWFELKGEQE